MVIGVCDDSLECVRGLIREIKNLLEPEGIKGYTKMEEFFEDLRSGRRYDVVFMDIHWGDGEQTGIDFGKKLYDEWPDMKLIYVTAQPEQFSQHIFLKKSNLRGFLIKPLDRKLLQVYLLKILKEQEEEKNNRLRVKCKGQVYSVPISHIRYIESEGHKLKIHTEKEMIICYERLAEVYKQLNSRFIQCHKSFVVNMEEVVRLENRGFILENGVKIPISKSQYTETKKRFFEFLGED